MYKKSKQLISSLLIILLVFISSCPCKAVENDLGLWTPVFITLPINKKVSSQLEINPRLQDDVTKFNQLFIRPSLTYNLNKFLSFTQGYSWNPLFHPFKNNQRIWQQVQLSNDFSKLRFENRFRLEERFIEGVSGVPVRGRYRIGTWIPLDKEKKWTFVTWDEIFVNFNSRPNGPQAGYDRNWLFTGINKKISENVNLEGGYMFQYINNTSPAQDLLNHVILVNLYVTLPQLMKRH